MEYQQFINWLRAKKVLKNYMREFNLFQDRLLSGQKISVDEFWLQQIRGKTVEEAFNIHKSNIIAHSFIWRDTLNRHKFWFDLHRSLRKYNEMLIE